MLKETVLPDTEALTLLDFSENYSLSCQDAIQVFHWETDHANLQDSISYYCISGPKKNGMKEEYVSFCDISDCLEHTAGNP
jgi:hypothetical protein